MTRRIVLFVVALTACAPARLPVVTPPSPLAPTAVAQRVVLLSFDGLGADALAARTDVPAFTALAREGTSARVIPVNPTVTSTTHATILTGALPEVHGIVANRFHVAGTPRETPAKGLETYVGVETLIDAAHRQGKRVGSIAYPGFDARKADFGLAWTTSVTTGRIVHLTRSDFHREWVPPTWTERPKPRVSYSPIMRARAEWSIPSRFRNDVDVVAYDTTDDSVENYDRFFIEAGERELAPDARGWFALSAETSEGVFGSWSKVLRTDRALADVTIYWGPISRSESWPDSFRSMLDTEVGFWPGAPDEHAGIDADTFIEQTVRLGDFLTRAETFAIAKMPFDLLLAYQPEVDTMGHNYLGRGAEGERATRAAFAAADQAVTAVRGGLDLTRDALIVTGDHGLARIDTEVRMNRFLSDAGFANWQAYASGNVAQLYRFGGADNTAELVNLLTTSPQFEKVERKTAASHPNSGDLLVYSFPNVLLSPSAESPAIAKPVAAANHGALNTHRELHTVLFAVGAGAPKIAAGEVAQTRIARFVAQLLGIAPPAAAQ